MATLTGTLSILWNFGFRRRISSCSTSRSSTQMLTCATWWTLRHGQMVTLAKELKMLHTLTSDIFTIFRNFTVGRSFALSDDLCYRLCRLVVLCGQKMQMLLHCRWMFPILWVTNTSTFMVIAIWPKTWNDENTRFGRHRLRDLQNFRFISRVRH